MLPAWHPAIRLLHITCVSCSGALFALRGGFALAGAGWVHRLAARALSWAIDTVLLAAAVLLAAIDHQYPFVAGWLTAKVLLLVLYVWLGGQALRRARTPRGRALAYVAALATFACIAMVAHWRDPLAPLHLLLR